tara:strand:- start:9248 stop:9796 length:549 start_codon:yes stop_codon:yes gene_type:complete
MSKSLLISDANILIDIIAAGLTKEMFSLQYDFAVPVLLFEQELKENHGHLVKSGLNLIDMEAEHAKRIETLGKQYNGVSAFDLMALTLAEEKEAPLLTGDRKLRQVCMAENIEVYGTLWLIEQMLIEKKIEVSQVETAYKKMEEDGSRLPWDEVEKQLKRLPAGKYDCIDAGGRMTHETKSR